MEELYYFASVCLQSMSMYMVPVAVARNSSNGIAICYVFLVLWMTLFSYHGTNWWTALGKIKLQGRLTSLTAKDANTKFNVTQL